MICLNKTFKNYLINCSAIKMGLDYNISIYGGDKSHIGAVALGLPLPSLQDNNKISSSVSLITVPTHKEDSIVLKAAKFISQELNSTVVVACGIHIGNITFDEIKELTNIIDNLIIEIVNKIKSEVSI